MLRNSKFEINQDSVKLYVLVTAFYAKRKDVHPIFLELLGSRNWISIVRKTVRDEKKSSTSSWSGSIKYPLSLQQSTQGKSVSSGVLNCRKLQMQQAALFMFMVVICKVIYMGFLRKNKKPNYLFCILSQFNQFENKLTTEEAKVTTASRASPGLTVKSATNL